MAKIKDVTRAVWFVLNDAPYMTGSVLRLDGGYVLGGAPVAPMPPGVPVATVGIDGSVNAAVLAAQIIGTGEVTDDGLRD